MEKDIYSFMSEKLHDPIHERRTCHLSSEDFAVYAWDVELLSLLSPTIAGKKYSLPLPTVTRQERQKQLMVRRNERALYRRESDLSGTSILSVYKPSCPYKLYTVAERRSDDRDAIDYARDIDWSTSIFEQIQELRLEVPHLALINDNMSTNSMYCNQTAHLKNCYLTFNSDNLEQCHYSWWAKHSSHSMDGARMMHCEQCYELTDCSWCFSLRVATDCEACSYSTFMHQCKNCKDCFWCVNLVNKQYCFFNEQLTKEAYEEKISSVDLWSREVYEEWKDGFETFKNRFPHRATSQRRTEKSTGHFLQDAEACMCCFETMNAQRCRYVGDIDNGAKDCMDYNTWWDNSQRIYSCVTVGENANNILFSINCRPDVSNLLYCDECVMSKDCFWCVGLKNKQYCIFNKQYTKEEYIETLWRLLSYMDELGELWTFFPKEHAPFAYNESVAQTYYPLEKQEALAQGYTRQDTIFDVNISSSIEPLTILPDHISDVDDSILEKIIQCPVSQRFFRIVESELSFYRKHQLPIPMHHPDVRFAQRIAHRPARNLYLAQCQKSQKSILTVHSPDSPFPVWSEEVWDKEFLG